MTTFHSMKWERENLFKSYAIIDNSGHVYIGRNQAGNKQFASLAEMKEKGFKAAIFKSKFSAEFPCATLGAGEDSQKFGLLELRDYDPITRTASAQDLRSAVGAGKAFASFLTELGYCFGFIRTPGMGAFKRDLRQG